MSWCVSTGPLTARRDEIFELADAVLCAGGPVWGLLACPWWLSTGVATGVKDAVNHGRIDVGWLRGSGRAAEPTVQPIVAS